MEEGNYASSKTGRDCEVPFLPPCPVIYPTYTSFCLKSFKNAVNFHPTEKWPCKNSWHRDLKSTHIRNWRLLDLPYKKPKCCSYIYNATMDRQKLKKLQKYGLTRQIRTKISELEPEEIKRCEPEEDVEEAKITYFPECYRVPEISSDDDEDDYDKSEEYEFCTSGSVSECSKCSTLGGGKKRKMHEVVKKDLTVIFRSKEVVCNEKVVQELQKHNLGQNFQLKLKKVF